MKHPKLQLFLSSLLILSPILLGLMIWEALPEIIATRFNLAGQAVSYTDRSFTVFGLPVLLLVVHLFLHLVLIADPKKSNINPKIIRLIYWLVPLLGFFVQWLILLSAIGLIKPQGTEAYLLLAALFIGMGNYLPKVRHNYTFGIRLPWTLADEENWYRTHRFTGKLWVAGGLLCLLTPFFSALTGWFIIPISIGLTFPPVFYSWQLSRKKQQREH